MVYFGARILAAAFLLINSILANDNLDAARSKRTLTTICVEIKPNGPMEEPYYMCKGTKLPASQKSPKTTTQDEDESGRSYANLASPQTSTTSNEEIDNNPIVSSMHGPGVSRNSSDEAATFDAFPKQSFYQSTQQVQQFPAQTWSQPAQWPQQRQFFDHIHQQQQKQQQQQMQPIVTFQQPPSYIRTSIGNERARPTSYFQSANLQPANASPFFPAYNLQQTPHAYPASSFNVHAPSQYRSEDAGKSPVTAALTSNFNEPTSIGRNVNFNGQSSSAQTYKGKPFSHKGASSAGQSPNGKPFVHIEPSFPAQIQTNVDTIPASLDEISPLYAVSPHSLPGVSRSQTAPATPFRTSTSPNANESPILLSPYMPLRPASFGEQRPNTMQRANLMQEPIPAAHRYRAMIDDEVLEVPKWGFSEDEFDLYRSPPEPNVGSEISTPPPPSLSIIPMEHLEYPMMRAFYNSLPGVPPLPEYKPWTAALIYTYPQQPTQQEPIPQEEAPIVTAPQRYEPALPNGSSCQTYSPQQPTQQEPIPQEEVPTVAAPQRYEPASPKVSSCQAYSPPLPCNQNQCTPSAPYNFQPVFFALPCYNPSVLKSVMPHITQYATIATNEYKQSPAFINPSDATYSPPPTSTPMPVQYADSVAATSSPTLSSNNSKESIEELDEPKVAMKAPKTLSDKLNPLIKKMDESISTPAGDIVAAPHSETTPSSFENDMSAATPTSTTFKSLFLTARKLAQLNADSQENSTPRTLTKRQRQSSRGMASGNGKRKFVPAM